MRTRQKRIIAMIAALFVQAWGASSFRAEPETALIVYFIATALLVAFFWTRLKAEGRLPALAFLAKLGLFGILLMLLCSQMSRKPSRVTPRGFDIVPVPPADPSTSAQS